MSKQFKTTLVLVFGILVGIGISITGNVLANKPQEVNGLPLDELRNFADVYARIKADYVEPVKDKTLIDNAIRGMVSGLDPHSTYMDPDQYAELRIDTTGQFGGLGIEVGMQDGFVKVISPIDDTPAYKAGIKPGDLIIKIDDKPVKGMTLNQAVKQMRGAPGSNIKLTIVRQGEDKPLTFNVKRAIIKVKSVKSRMLEPGYAYVRITNFQARTGRDMVAAIDKLIKENKGPLKGLILDLRNNPGGVLNAAADVVDAFVNSGKIVYTEGRVKDSHIEFDAHPGDILHGAPIVVLVNGGSASASEIVAGALQDHHRAVLMGTRTFGKGSVQTIMELRNGGAVKITTARYFTPNGRSIQNEGITPDITLAPLELAKTEGATGFGFTEADLSHHLSNPTKSQKQIKHVEKIDAVQAKETEMLTKQDYQLHEALTLLKGLNVFSSDALANKAKH